MDSLLADITNEIQEDFDVKASVAWNEFDDECVECEDFHDIVLDMHNMFADGCGVGEILITLERNEFELSFVANEPVDEWTDIPHMITGTFSFSGLRVNDAVVAAKVHYIR